MNLWYKEPSQKPARDYLIELRLDWKNNYLSLADFAEHNGLTEEEAKTLLKLAVKVSYHKHPEN